LKIDNLHKNDIVNIYTASILTFVYSEYWTFT